MAYDAVKMKDWEISEAAEANMPTPDEWRDRLNLQKDESIPFGRLCRLEGKLQPQWVFWKVWASGV